MENNNFNQMMMGMNSPMMMDMNNQMMGGMNNQMMMGMNNQMMNICPMNNMNMAQNMGMMGMGTMEFTFPPNNPGFNKLNHLNNNGMNNPNCKVVKLFYEYRFIREVTLFGGDYYSISNIFKEILYSLGEKSYRGARPEEIIERNFPYETLENLIYRGVVDEKPIIEIKNRSRNKNYYYYNSDHMFEDIQNGDELVVRYGSQVIGAGGLCNIDFVNVDKSTKTQKIDISKDAPIWRQVSVGLNLFGKCINKKCKAFNEEVVYRVGINKIFDFNSNRKSIICPICSKNFVPITMGFWKCEYQIKGEKLKNGDYEEVNINGKETKGDNFEYFNPYKNETASWSKLMICTGHRQKMKYKEERREN